MKKISLSVVCPMASCTRSNTCARYAQYVKVLANAEITTMINAFGCGFSEGYGNDFDITKLRYDKIIIMADADVPRFPTSPASL